MSPGARVSGRGDAQGGAEDGLRHGDVADQEG